MWGRHLLVASLSLVACPIFDTSGVGSGGVSVGVGGTDDSGTTSAEGEGSTSSGSTSGGSTSAADTSATASSSTTAATDPTADDTSVTTGDVGDPGYPPCSVDDACPDPLAQCMQVFQNEVIGRVCASPCALDMDCKSPESGTAIPVCSEYGTCRLVCDRTDGCPDGMTCFDTTDGPVCAYPE